MIEDDVLAIAGKRGTPAMYVINYKNDKGYVIVSASKNYYPILMKADYGKFALSSIPETFEWYLDTYKNNIDNLQGDTIRQYRQEWDFYANSQTAITRSTASLPVEIIRFMENSCIKWQDQFCEISPIAANGLNLPPEVVYRKALYIAELSLREDYMETTFIIKKGEMQEDKVSPMISTRWNRDPPYNAAVQKHFGKNYPTGCVATAMAQIMKYHHKPQQYNWNGMSPEATSSIPNWDIAGLMLDIGLSVKMDYGLDGSGAYNDDALRGFHLFGYNHAALVTHDKFKVRDNLFRSRPVFMTGRRQHGGEKIGHAWVCDRVKEQYHRTVYYVMTLYEGVEGFSYILHEIMVEKGYASRLFHMNWGYSGDGNGWFRDENLKFNLSEKDEYNCTTHRKDIINLY